MSPGEAFASLEQAWRFQELVGESYLELCTASLVVHLHRQDYLVVEIDRSERTTNLLYWLESRGIRADMTYPGGRLAARLSLSRERAAA